MTEQKTKAVNFMRQLDIYKPYIDAFIKSDKVCFFEGWGGFYVDQEQEINDKMKEIEKEYDIVVYAITHEKLEFGECYDFLCVPKDFEDDELQEYNNGHVAYAYCWNKDIDDFSEFGDIVVKSYGGGIKRIG